MNREQFNKLSKISRIINCNAMNEFFDYKVFEIKKLAKKGIIW